MQYERITGEGLFVPAIYLQHLCSNIELQYGNVIDRVLHVSKIRSHNVTSIMKNADIPQEFKRLCHIMDLIVNLYANIHLHHSLRENNREFKSVKGKKQT